MTQSLNEWGCLKEGRKDYMPSPKDDAHLILCHREVIQERVLDLVKGCMATDRPIKMIIFGDWGIGKTHLLYHLEWWLNEHKDEFPVKSVLVEIGDITKKSRFNEIVRPLLDKLGIDFLIQLVNDYKNIETNVEKALLSVTGVTHKVARNINTLLVCAPGSLPSPAVVDAYNFLRGEGNDGDGGPAIEQSKDFVAVLKCIGEMHKAVNNGEKLVFLVDEGQLLVRVDDDSETKAHWIAANRNIFDQENDSFGFVYTISDKDEDDLPDALWDPQITTRLGPDGSVQFENLDQDYVEEYLDRLLEAFMDSEEVERRVREGTIPSESSETSPFTVGARQEFIEQFAQHRENSTPRSISKHLVFLALRSLKGGKPVIDSDVIRERSEQVDQ